MAIAVLVGVAAAAAAQESAVTEPALNWVRLEGAHDCLSAAQLADKVERRVGHTLFVATTEAELFVDGSVRGAPSPSGSGRLFEVQLEVSTRSGEVLGERALAIEGGACSAIDDAVSLVIAVTLYPRSSLVVAGIPLDPSTAASLTTLFGDEPTDPDPNGLPRAELAAGALSGLDERSPRSSRPSPTQEGTARIRGTELSLDAIGAIGAGQLPGVRLAIGGSVRVAPPGMFPIEAGFLRYLSASTEVPGGGAVDFELTTGSLTACPWSFVSSDLRGCVGLEGGVLGSTPHGLARSGEPGRDFVLNILVGAVYRPRIAGPLHARIALLAGVPLLQHEFVYQARDGSSPTLFQTSQIQGRADFGAGISF